MESQALLNGIKLAYTDQGKGTPLVFLHAFPLSQAMWAPQVEALSGSYRVITLDFRGHGSSQTALWNFTLDEYADDVMALLNHLDINQAVMIGLSMGGYTALSIARRYGNRLKGLVLADTRAQADNSEGRSGRKTMAQVAYKKGASAIADLMLPKLLAPSTPKDNPKLTAGIRQLILGTKPEGIITDLMAMAVRPDSTDLLPQIECPTLIIVGEDDQATPVADSEYLADRIPKSTLAVIPKAGHLSNLEQPQAFNDALGSFLQKLET